MDPEKLLRKNIRELKPYSSARDEYSGSALVYLDANENPFNHPYNRYPDPLQKKLKEKISELKGIPPASIFLGNGSDEPIDLLIRAFCEPGSDQIVITDPTYGMYEVAAGINDVKIQKIPLGQNFELNPDLFLRQAEQHTKLAFLCSPNNPTANSFSGDTIQKIIDNFNGLVILDEAYIDFVPDKSFLPQLLNYPNLVILQTFSKAWGMAGLRLGMAFASPFIIGVLNKIKYPYNLNILVQEKAWEWISTPDQKNNWVKTILEEKKTLMQQLAQFPFTIKVYPSDANFILVKMHDARGVYDFLVEKGIIVRDRSTVHLCENALRITVGSSAENNILLNALNDLIK